MPSIHIAAIAAVALIAIGLLLWHGKERLWRFIAPWATLLVCDWILLHCNTSFPTCSQDTCSRFSRCCSFLQSASGCCAC